jgi:hypothetical protein
MEFSPDDLVFNRRGELSPAQRQKLEVMYELFVQDLHDAPPLHLPSVFQLIGLGLAVGILHLVGLFDRLQHWFQAWYQPLLIGGALIILVRFLWIQIRYSLVRRLLPDMLKEMIQAPALYSITGEARLDLEELPQETNAWLTIQDQRFPLTTHAAQVFQAGRTYRVFYVIFADASVLMSAEWLKTTDR